jgi:hypothetical protein
VAEQDDGSAGCLVIQVLFGAFLGVLMAVLFVVGFALDLLGTIIDGVSRQLWPRWKDHADD